MVVTRSDASLKVNRGFTVSKKNVNRTNLVLGLFQVCNVIYIEDQRKLDIEREVVKI